jgi:hypothetical protein
MFKLIINDDSAAFDTTDDPMARLEEVARILRVAATSVATGGTIRSLQDYNGNTVGLMELLK